MCRSFIKISFISRWFVNITIVWVFHRTHTVQVVMNCFGAPAKAAFLEHISHHCISQHSTRCDPFPIVHRVTCILHSTSLDMLRKPHVLSFLSPCPPPSTFTPIVENSLSCRLCLFPLPSHPCTGARRLVTSVCGIMPFSLYNDTYVRYCKILSKNRYT